MRFLAGRLKDQAAGERDALEASSASRQASLALAHLRCGDTYAQLAAGFGIGIVTVHRCIREAVEAPAAIAPFLAEAMRTITRS